MEIKTIAVNLAGTSKNSSICRMPSCNHLNILGRVFVRRSFSKCPLVNLLGGVQPLNRYPV